MASVSITDSVQLTGSVDIGDNSPLALAQLKHLDFSHVPVVGEFGKPIDQFALDEAEVGVLLTAPSLRTGGGTALLISGGVNGTLSIYHPKQENLFGDEQFAPALKIDSGECWAGLCIKAKLDEEVSAKAASGFGVSLSTDESLAVTTFVRFPYPGAAIPAFKEGLRQLLEAYSVAATPAEICAIPTGKAHAVEATGSVSLGISYAAPLTVSPFATLGLPLNLSLKVVPTVVGSVEGAIKVSGSFIVRTYRSAASRLVIGLYKKHETTLSASLTASAGMEADIGKTDILAKVLNAVVQGADIDSLQLGDAQKEELSEGLKQCIDQSISIALNACCAASESDEAAVIYELDLSKGDMSVTDEAIAAALRGDWSKLETLSNATPIRHIVREIKERNHSVNVNLLGFYNATSLRDYLKSTTVLQDEHGQISIVDKVTAKTLSAETTPYAAKSEKLRSLLARDFIATATYGACAGKLGITAFSVHQSMLEYHANASGGDLKGQAALAKIFGFALSPEQDAIVRANGRFSHNKFSLDVVYDLDCVYRLFYQNVDAHAPYLKDTLDSIARKAKIDLLDPAAANSTPRLVALRNDETWKAMNECGNVTRFRFLPSLARLEQTALGAISADWTDIRWWSDAMMNIAPALTALLTAVAQAKSADPLADAAFLTAHKKLENVLEKLGEDTNSAFGDGWPLAVMYRVASSATGSPAQPAVEMDISINGKSQSQNTGQIEKTQSGAA